MKLRTLIEQYVTHRRSLGEAQGSNGRQLRAFGRAIGGDADMTDVCLSGVNMFLGGKAAITLNWHIKLSVLRAFYEYAVSRGYADKAPLPLISPKRPPSFVPHIYTQKELRSLLIAAKRDDRPQGCIAPETMRTLLVVIYAAGLRIQELVDLNRIDVNLPDSLMTIHQSKFGKTRLAPFGSQLQQVLLDYTHKQGKSGANAPFFATRTGNRIKPDTLQHNFRLLCQSAHICRTDGARYQPRLHDLRHTFAVHRLVSWYRRGKDVQKFLPLLSIYLGHVHIRHTQVYLTMTPELLQEAGIRFEQYERSSHD